MTAEYGQAELGRGPRGGTILLQKAHGKLHQPLLEDGAAQSQHQALVVPTTSVLYDDQNFPFVYLQVEAGKFAQRAIKIGGQQQDQIEVLDGLKEGDRVVSQGSVFLQFASTFQE